MQHGDRRRGAALVVSLFVVACGLAVLQAAPATQPAGLELRRELHAKQTAARRQIAEAHELLDKGEYDAAVAGHQQAAVLLAEVRDLEKRIDAALQAQIDSCVQELSSDDFDKREAATAALMSLGPRALPLVRAVKTTDPEVQSRLNGVIAHLLEVDDDDGAMHQWATAARASSECTATSWSAKQACGKPDTAGAGDLSTAWAPLAPVSATTEWIELTYATAVRPTAIRVRETLTPGAVTKVEAQDQSGTWRKIWDGKDPTAAAPGWLVATCDGATWTTQAVRISVDNSIGATWKEIDAVELIGDAAGETGPATRPASRE